MATGSEIRSLAPAIKMTAAIIHILRSRLEPGLAASNPALEGLVLSDQPFPADTEPVGFAYLAEQILGSRKKNQRLATAQFIEPARGTGPKCAARPPAGRHALQERARGVLKTIDERLRSSRVA